MRFALDRYWQVVGPVAVDDLDFAVFDRQPLDRDALRCLRYMHDIEAHTVCYLRDLLVTRVHRDPAVTTFLTCWNFEEHFHGEAIALVLAAHGEPAGIDRVRGLRRRLGWRDRLAPLLAMSASAVTPDFGAVHMAWGALNEWTTQAAYGRLVARTGHPLLRELLRRIMRQEGRHIHFYASEAQRRLTGNRRAQRLTRHALRWLWAPVGSSVMPHDEVRFVVNYLFGDADGQAAAERIDRQLDRLPGLDGLGLVSRARTRLSAAG